MQFYLNGATSYLWTRGILWHNESQGSFGCMSFDYHGEYSHYVRGDYITKKQAEWGRIPLRIKRRF